MKGLTLFALLALPSLGTPSPSLAREAWRPAEARPTTPWPNGLGWAMSHYALDAEIDFRSERIEGRAEITIRNRTGTPLREVPVLLYRLMTVSSAAGPRAEELAYSQSIETYEDYDRLQVNFIHISLPAPVPPGESFTLSLTYGGYLEGLSEAYPYVKEAIDPFFTLLRDDSGAYPTVGYPSRNANRSRPLDRWSYEARITVPDSLTVANGGELLERTTGDGLATYHYASKAPSWRMDFAVAPYRSASSGENTVFALPEDSSQLEPILAAMDETLALYTRWFGPLRSHSGLTVIEIPEGYGSQTDVTAIIQRAEAFKDPKNLHELYHELSHKWNVPATDEHPPRIEEGLAVFLESLTVEKLEGREYLDGYMDALLDYARRIYGRSPGNAAVAMADFGEAGVEGMSYSVGAVFFRLLYDRVGPAAFNGIIRSLYADRFETGATLDQIMDYVRAEAGTDVDDLLADWIYGTRYGELIQEGLGVEGLLAVYARPPSRPTGTGPG